jgi:mRNA interferase MazF
VKGGGEPAFAELRSLLPLRRRPALVVSNDLFNEHTGFAIVCPITNTDRGFPFHLAVPRDTSLTGFVMVEQVKSVNHVMRGAKFVERAPDGFVADVLDLIDTASDSLDRRGRRR